MTCVHVTSLGAYVLGALDADDRLETERHLRDCPLCRDELVRLTPLPGLLGQVSLSDVTGPESAPWTDIAALPLAPTQSPTRRHPVWRGLGMAAAVAAIVVGVVVAGRVVVDDSTPAASVPAAAATWSTSAGSGGIDATAVLSARDWGTDIDLTMAGLPMGQRCRLVVRSDDGRAETAGWWTTGTGYGTTTAEIPASTSLDVDAIDRLEVVLASGRVLAVLTPPT